MNFTPSTIQTNLLSVVKFEQPLNPLFPTLNSNLTTGTSGITINDGEIPYLTLENIKALAGNYRNYDFAEYNSATTYITGNRIKYVYPTWDSLTTYNTGERVVYLGVGYESLIDTNLNSNPAANFDNWEVKEDIFSIYDSLIDANLNNQPDINSVEWSEVNLFNTFLESRLKSSIINVVNKCTENRNKILEQKRLYYGIGDGTETITNESKFAGVKIDFIKRANIKIKINKIGFHFSGAETDLVFYVKNQNTQQTTVTGSTTNNDFTWVDVEDFDITTDKEGSWFIYYNQDDLSNEAINNNIIIPNNVSNFAHFNMFKTDNTITDFKTIDTDNYVYNESCIANIDYTVLADITDWIIQNKNIFAQSIKYQFGLDMFKIFLTNENQRINRSERGIDLQNIQTNVYTTDAETVKKIYNDEIEKLRISIGKAKIDNISLPTQGFMFNYGTNL